MLRTASDRRSGGRLKSMWHAYRRKAGVTLCGLDLSLLILWDHPYARTDGADRCEACRLAAEPAS